MLVSIENVMAIYFISINLTFFFLFKKVYDGIPNPLPSGESGYNIQSLWSAGSLSYAPDYSQFTEFPPVINGKSDKMTILFLGDTLENTQLIASKRPARWQATYTIG